MHRLHRISRRFGVMLTVVALAGVMAVPVTADAARSGGKAAAKKKASKKKGKKKSARRSKRPPNDLRVTGGGRIFNAQGVMVTHGFELYCNLAWFPNNLEVNWDGGNHWHLERITGASCYDTPGVRPEQPSERFSPVDTFEGVGEGRWNNQPATAQWRIIDGGEPGTRDQFAVRIVAADGTVVLDAGDPTADVANANYGGAFNLTRGNHQFHRVTGGGSPR
jgi:hypothetical protein